MIPIIDQLMATIDKWLRGILLPLVESGARGMYSSISEQVGKATGLLMKGPNSNVFGGMYDITEKIHDNIMVPIAGGILGVIACVELIQMVIDKNNANEFEMFSLFKWVFKIFLAAMVATNSWKICMGIFDLAGNIVANISGMVTTDINTSTIDTVIAKLSEVDGAGKYIVPTGSLFGLAIQFLVINLGSKILSVIITVAIYMRLMNIYLTLAFAPIPMSTFANREMSNIGQNYIRNLIALAFQAAMMMVILAMYVFVANNIGMNNMTAENIGAKFWEQVGMMILCVIMLLKTDQLSKSLFSAH